MRIVKPYNAPVANEDSWRKSGGTAVYREPGHDHFGWWVIAALLLSLLLHVVAFFALDQVKIVLGFPTSQELVTGPIDTKPVEISAPDIEELPPRDEVVMPPKDLAPLLDEVDILDKLPKDQDIDMVADIDRAVFDLKIQNPVQSGDPEGATEISAKGFIVDSDLKDFGRTETSLNAAADGQIVIDPGALKSDEFDSSKLVDDLLKKGGRGKVEKGSLEGAIDDLLGLPANVLVGKTTTLPGDLLFEYNSADLRESARVGLMKLGTLIDTNPGLVCWIDGYSDLFGGDDFNYSLSERRAESVKKYLTTSLGIEAKRIFPRGFGKQQPKVPSGSIDEQAPNRRVEIKMRKTPPPAVERIASAPPPRAEPVVAPEPPVPPKAVVVKPLKALPVVEDPPAPVPPRASPVEETPPPPVAVPRAEAVEE
jgi:OmpA-OmpF porin, OOP family